MSLSNAGDEEAAAAAAAMEEGREAELASAPDELPTNRFDMVMKKTRGISVAPYGLLQVTFHARCIMPSCAQLNSGHTLWCKTAGASAVCMPSLRVTCVELHKCTPLCCCPVHAAQCCCLCRSPTPLRWCASWAPIGLVYAAALDLIAALHGHLTMVQPWLQIPITFAAVCLEVHHGEVQVAMEAPLDAEALVWRFPLQVAQGQGCEGALGRLLVSSESVCGGPPDGVADCCVALRQTCMSSLPVLLTRRCGLFCRNCDWVFHCLHAWLHIELEV